MKQTFLQPEEITTIELLESEVKKVFLLNDAGVVKVVVATVVANRMELDPVWLLLIAAPSSGKTELIQALNGLPFVFPISDLTVNTLASGQKRVGKETSLLLKVNNGILSFKDFSSILSKAKEARAEIMKQLREVFDGSFVKRTGTGDDITWAGKIGAIGGCTEIIYRYLEEMSAMGDRFVMYSIQQPDRIAMSRKMLENASEISEMRDHMKACFTSYINLVISNMTTEDIELEETMREELFLVADFATRARSAVLCDFKTGAVNFVPSPEMPARLSNQLFTLASAFVTMNRANPQLPKGHPAHQMNLTVAEKRLLFKIAFDSIPRTRRNVLYPLAQYEGGVTTAGLATWLNLPTESVRTFLQQINALNLCTRTKHGGGGGDLWKMLPEYRKIMLLIDDLKVSDGILSGLDDDEWDDDTALSVLEDFGKNRETLDFDVPL